LVPVWLAVAAVAGIGTLSAHAQEVIHNYDQIVRVARDGTLTVTEAIRVRAEGASIKRGIYRDFPLTFTDATGGLREVTFSLIDVTRDGAPEPHFTKREGDAIRIYAGEEDVFIPTGDHTYVITYETGRQIRWFDGAPELYWNVTGNFWSFPITAASVRVELPDGARPERWTAYTGQLGAQGKDWRGDIDSEGTLTVKTTRPLGPGEGLTIVVAIPPGAVEPPSEADELWYAILDYRGWILGFLGFALILGYYAWAWHGVGRDPKGGVIIPLFHPPKGISPALANYIRKWGFGRERWRAFTAAALSLAVKGHLLFDDADETLTLKTAGGEPAGGPAALPPGERAILNWVKGQGGTAIIDRKNGTAVAKIGTDFTKSIEGENRSRFFRHNLGYFIGGLVLTALVGAVILGFGGLRDPDIGILVATAIFGVAIGAFVIPMIRAVLGITGIGSALRVALPLIVFLAIAGFMVSQFLRAVVDQAGGVTPMVQSMFGAILALIAAHPLPVALVLGFAGVNGLFLYLLRAPTDLGRKVMDQLEGLRLYLDTAESARLNLQAPEITAEKFEELLPYAVALDVEKPWSEAFAAALSRAHPDDADPTAQYHPRWRTGGAWSGAGFGSAVTSTVAGMSAALASSVPVSSGSSGFSGGGGSGGGGGGGGGGGW
jgi:uncharacterized membrane protein YgcG